jgi:hypothetical protein
MAEVANKTRYRWTAAPLGCWPTRRIARLAPVDIQLLKDLARPSQLMINAARGGPVRDPLLPRRSPSAFIGGSWNCGGRVTSRSRNKLAEPSSGLRPLGRASGRRESCALVWQADGATIGWLIRRSIEGMGDRDVY